MEENQIKNQPVKRNGFYLPFHFLQVTSWILLLKKIILLYGFILPFMQSTERVVYYVLYSVFLSQTVIFGIFSTASDPTDPLYYYEKLMLKTNKKFQETNRYCTVCQTHVQLQTKHCGNCNRCVEEFDHHWYFICLLIALMLQVIVEIILCIECITLYGSNKSKFQNQLRDCNRVNNKGTQIGLVILLLIPNLFIMGFLIDMIVFHIYLNLSGMSTYDYIIRKRETAQKKVETLKKRTHVIKNVNENLNIKRDNNDISQQWNQNQNDQTTDQIFNGQHNQKADIPNDNTLLSKQSRESGKIFNQSLELPFNYNNNKNTDYNKDISHVNPPSQLDLLQQINNSNLKVIGTDDYIPQIQGQQEQTKPRQLDQLKTKKTKNTKQILPSEKQNQSNHQQEVLESFKESPTNKNNISLNEIKPVYQSSLANGEILHTRSRKSLENQIPKPSQKSKKINNLMTNNQEFRLENPQFQSSSVGQSVQINQQKGLQKQDIYNQRLIDMGHQYQSLVQKECQSEVVIDNTNNDENENENENENQSQNKNNKFRANDQQFHKLQQKLTQQAQNISL